MWSQDLRTLEMIKRPNLRLHTAKSGSWNKSKSIENMLNKIMVENFPNLRKEMIFQAQVIEPQPDMVRETPVHSVPWSRGQTSVRHDQRNTCPQCTMVKGPDLSQTWSEKHLSTVSHAQDSKSTKQRTHRFHTKGKGELLRGGERTERK